MAGSVKKPARAADWSAIRRDYETGTDPLWKVAERHGITPSKIDHRRRREGWQCRRDIARIHRGLGTVPKHGSVDWGKIQAEYENGEFSVWDICDRHGIGQNTFYRHKRLEEWEPRRAAFPKAYGAGGTVNAAERLKGLVARELATIEARLGLGDKLDIGDPLRALHTLASAVQKILDIERKERAADDAGRGLRLSIDDASRLALAQRLEALARHWETAGHPGGT